MSIKFELLDKLVEYEKRFSSEIREKNIMLLRDVRFTDEDYVEIVEIIKGLLKSKDFESIKNKGSITLSLYLVWCSIYNYKDGDMWNPILSGINVNNSPKNSRLIGELFLDTLKKYKLITVNDQSFKKYFSQIMLHGYISNDYSGKLFDVLNRYYENLLDRDTSISNIESVWELMFPEDDNYKKNNPIRRKLEDEIINLENNLSEIGNTDYYIAITREELSKLENELLILNDEIEEKCLIKIDRIITIDDQLEFIKLSDEMLTKINDISNRDTDFKIVDNDLICYLQNSFIEIKKEAMQRKMQEDDEFEELNSIIQKLRYEQSIRNKKISDIKNKISILGSGDLDTGLELLGEINDLKSQISFKKKELENINKIIMINDDINHTSFTQTFTASLNYLRQASPEIFKTFMIEALQMMDMYFKHHEIDSDYMLSDQFINWYNEGMSKQNYKVNSYSPNNTDKESDSIANNYKSKNKYKIHEHFIHPALELKSDKRTLELVIPQKVFSRTKFNHINPICKLIYENKSIKDIELIASSQYNDTIVYEYKSDITNLLSSVNIYWQNIRDYFEVSFDGPVVFDINGKRVHNQVLGNGIYNILINSDWSTHDSYISKLESSIPGYYIYEVELNETSLLFFNEFDKESYCFNASKYNTINVEGLNIAEGITSKGLEVITGNLPRIVYNKQVIDDEDLSLYINIDNFTKYEYKLIDKSESEEINKNVFILDLNTIIEKSAHPLELEFCIKDNLDNILLCHKNIWTSNTEFKYENNEIIIKYPSKARVKHPLAAVINGKARVPLLNTTSEEIEVYYDRHGAVKYEAEIPSLNFYFNDSSGVSFDIDTECLKDELIKLKDSYINFEVKGSIARAVELKSCDNSFNITLPLKQNKSKIRIDEIRDLFCDSCDEDALLFRWAGKESNGNFSEIIKIHRMWSISDLDIYQEEQEAQYLIELTYNQNFEYKGKKYIQVINQGSTVFEKELENDTKIFYIKKDSITNQDIEITIYRKSEYGLFGSSKIVVGKINVVLNSIMKEIEDIKLNGLTLTSFMYTKKNYILNSPLKIINITDLETKNFKDESVFKGEINIAGLFSEVIIYIDFERKRLPLLLDNDRDGAQCDSETMEVFWEMRKGSSIIGPIEDFTYEIEGS